jgi:glycosyltransferase involved in cell wall biosynthesis
VLPLPPRLLSTGDSGIKGRSAFGFALKAPAVAFEAISYLRRLRKLIRDERPDVVQTNGMKAHLLGAWAAPPDIPVVWHLHDYLSGRLLMGRLLRGSVRPELKVVAVSRSVAEDATKVLGPRVPVVAILNAVDLQRFSPGEGQGREIDAAAGLPPAPEGTIRVGLVATYARWKGHDVFIEAISRIPRDRPARFFIAGSPLYRGTRSQWSIAELRALAERFGVLDRIGFVPHCDDPEALYRSLDVVVHASTRPEPFGRVIVEAMACGRAVVATPSGGAAELFTDGISALGSPAGDPSALADRLIRLIDEPATRVRIGEAGRIEAVKRFDRARLTEEWGRVYRG